jgi:hypothetical protein
VTFKRPGGLWCLGAPLGLPRACQGKLSLAHSKAYREGSTTTAPSLSVSLVPIGYLGAYLRVSIGRLRGASLTKGGFWKYLI